MDRLTTPVGRYVPPASAATHAERLRALEVFITKNSEAMEYATDATAAAVAELQAAVSALRQRVDSLTKETES